MFADHCDGCGTWQLDCDWYDDLDYPDPRVLCGPCAVDLGNRVIRTRPEKGRT